jgi:hypothetical protein
MLSRVKLVPGKPIVCKSNGGFDPCRRTRVHTMNCGEAVAQTWVPAPGEPVDIHPDQVDEDEDLPSQSGGSVVAPAKQ